MGSAKVQRGEGRGRWEDPEEREAAEGEGRHWLEELLLWVRLVLGGGTTLIGVSCKVLLEPWVPGLQEFEDLHWG